MESIRRARLKVGLTVTDVADRTGFLPPAIHRAERANVDPRASTLARIAKALGVPVCALFPEDGHGRRR